MHRRHVSTVIALLALSCVSEGSALALEIAVGAPELIYTTKQLKQRKVATWPDGSLGVESNGAGGYAFYGANGATAVKTTGTLTDPALTSTPVKINNLPAKTYDYVSGGPVYRDPGTGARLMIYHAEKQGKTPKNFYSVLGMAVSTDPQGLVFNDLGTFVEPNLQSGQTEVGGGSFAVLNGYLNVYYRDWFPDGSISQTAVARAPLLDLMSNAVAGRQTSFSKYYNGNWTQPGVGGLASPLEIGNPVTSWVGVSYNDYLNQMVMVSSQWEAGGGDLYMATSSDGVNFSPRQSIALARGEQYYPSLVGTGSDPTHTGQSFYVYYTDSQKGGFNRWKDAALVRRSITLDPFVPPVVTPPAPTPTEWALVSDYRADFQSRTPAAGWQYDWNSTGKLGNSSKFTQLKWSDVAQAYNTTGVATTAPTSKKSHPDDYLTLASGGGHPGLPGTFPIVGYTIQADDGAGDYRIADSSIRKLDSVVSGTEDGLQVLVYVNNTTVGPAAAVSTNGLLASFDRALGQLKVGDTIWVIIDALKNQTYDGFTDFDFGLQKLVPAAGPTGLMAMQLSGGWVAIPEPSSASLAFTALAGLAFWPTFRRRGATRYVSVALVSRPC